MIAGLKLNIEPTEHVRRGTEVGLQLTAYKKQYDKMML